MNHSHIGRARLLPSRGGPYHPRTLSCFICDNLRTLLSPRMKGNRRELSADSHRFSQIWRTLVRIHQLHQDGPMRNGGRSGSRVPPLFPPFDFAHLEGAFSWTAKGSVSSSVLRTAHWLRTRETGVVRTAAARRELFLTASPCWRELLLRRQESRFPCACPPWRHPSRSPWYSRLRLALRADRPERMVEHPIADLPT